MSRSKNKILKVLDKWIEINIRNVHKILFIFIKSSSLLNIPCFFCPYMLNDSFSTFPQIIILYFHKFILMNPNTYAFSILKQQISACYEDGKII